MHQDAKEILDIVAKELNISTDDILSKSRKREIVEARMLCYYFMRRHFFALRELKVSFSTIGQWFNQDHSTVIHGCKTTEDLNQSNREFKKKYLHVDAVVRYFKGTQFNHIPQY